MKFLSDRIRPYLRLYVPPGKLLGRYYYFFQSSFSAEFDLRAGPTEGRWVEFPLGIFLLSSPTRKDEKNSIYRDVEAYDGLLILRDDKFDSRYTVPAGTNYRQAVIDILSSAGMEEELDLFNVPNKWVVVCSNAEQSLFSTYMNDNPNSPTSTVSRGRTIVDYREVTDIAAQQSLDAYVQRIAFETSQVYGKITFETAINPLHDYMDVLQLEYSPLGIKDKYVETGWTMPLKAGARMKHEVRKVVSI
jgi:hypothetical protein